MDIDGRTLHVRDTGGDKPALVMVHGIMMDGSVWEAQSARFADTHRVVCPDLRGHGASPADAPEISFEDHSADLLGMIEGLGLRDVTYVGWSMGGAIAQVFAAEHQDRLMRLVLVDTTPQLVASPDFPHAVPAEAAQELGGMLASDFAAGCAAFSGLAAPEDNAVAARMAAISAATSPAVALAAFASSGARTQWSELDAIEVETHVICGAEDGICPPGASDAMAARIPGCTTPVHRIEGAGHVPFMTRTAAFDDVLSRILV